MKRAIVVASDHRFMSAIVGKETASALKVGDRVTATRDIDIDGCGGVLPTGEQGNIVSIDETQGYVEVLFDNPIEALHEWRNILLLVPFDTPDYIDGLALETCLEAKEIDPPRRAHRSRPALCYLVAAAILVAFLAGWFLDPPRGAMAEVVTVLHLDLSTMVP